MIHCGYFIHFIKFLAKNYIKKNKKKQVGVEPWASLSGSLMQLPITFPQSFKLMVCTVARSTEEEQNVASRECFKVIVWHFGKCTRLEERIDITFASVCEISGWSQKPLSFWMVTGNTGSSWYKCTSNPWSHLIKIMSFFQRTKTEVWKQQIRVWPEGYVLGYFLAAFTLNTFSKQD